MGSGWRHFVPGLVTLALVLAAGLLPSQGPPALAAPVLPRPLKFATYNLCKLACGSGSFSNLNRRPAMVNNIVASGADVIGIQEGYKTIGAIKSELEGSGYRLANTPLGTCRNSCTRDSYILYKTSTVEIVSTSPDAIGWGKLSELVNLPRWTSKMDRNYAFAALRDRRTGGAFLAVSTHLPPEKRLDAEFLRNRSVGGLALKLADVRAKLGAADLPTVVMADLNSFNRRQPKGAQFEFSLRGYEDAFSAPRKVNADVPTINVTKTQRDPFPPKPFRFMDPARIDYVMFSSGRALVYEVFLKLLKNGRFDNAYRASDHNMVVGTLLLPVVTVPAEMPGPIVAQVSAARAVVTWAGLAGTASPGTRYEVLQGLPLDQWRQVCTTSDDYCDVGGLFTLHELYRFQVRACDDTGCRVEQVARWMDPRIVDS